MKTFREFAETLPEDIRERYIEYTIDTYKRVGGLDIKPHRKDAYVMGAFKWGKTNEGFFYWMLVDKGKYDAARKLLSESKK